MALGNAVFGYNAKKGILHKVPAVIKLLLLLPLSFICMSLPTCWLGVGIVTAVLAALISGISLRDQITDFKPVLFYAVLMYAIPVFSNLLGNFTLAGANQFYARLVPDGEYLRITLRLALVVQISALLFRTTSALEIREVVKLEIISIFLGFIPEIFKIWTSVNIAWKSRGGKEGVAKIRKLCFILIAICFEKAAIKSKAARARSWARS